ncbi:hypothetical protein [Nocardia asiatica]|uniref:hypothetical protein n=1 Tax=Nocardia asiatica TaxID=209252 RepID=UPI00030B114C|nr:hypothetical protein [Nocardia asiatica]
MRSHVDNARAAEAERDAHDHRERIMEILRQNSAGVSATEVSPEHIAALAISPH